MRPMTGVGLVLFLLGGLVVVGPVACQFPPPTPTSTPLPTATSTLTPIPTSTPVPTSTPTPTPTPSPLTDDEALALVREELARRGVDVDRASVVLKDEPRTLSIRYPSSYDPGSSPLRSQLLLIVVAVSRAMLRVQPPVEGGIQVGMLPEKDPEIGLYVISVDWPTLEAWANGSMTDQEFVAAWSMGAVPTE